MLVGKKNYQRQRSRPGHSPQSSLSTYPVPVTVPGSTFGVLSIKYKIRHGIRCNRGQNKTHEQSVDEHLVWPARFEHGKGPVVVSSGVPIIVLVVTRWIVLLIQ